MALARRNYWTVVQTKQGDETLAARHCRQQNFEPFLPRYRARRSAAGVRRQLPLFPSYLFVLVRVSQRWQLLASTRGVSRVIFAAGTENPARLPTEFVEEMRARENALGYVVLESEEPPVFGEAQFVMPRFGALKGIRGVHLGTVANRCRVLFEMLGRKVEKTMSVYDLEAA